MTFRGHSRSNKDILNFQDHLFLRFFLVERPIFLKLYKNVNMMMPQFFHSGHSRSYKTTFSFMPKSFVYWPILMKFCMNADIMKTHIWPELSLLYYGEVLWFVYFWPNYNFDLRSYGQLLFSFFFSPLVMIKKSTVWYLFTFGISIFYYLSWTVFKGKVKPFGSPHWWNVWNRPIYIFELLGLWISRSCCEFHKIS